MAVKTLMDGEFPTKVGDRLPNSGIIIAEQVLVSHVTERESIILCMVPGAVQPYVTWRRIVRVSRTATNGQYIDDYCWSGDYFEDLSNAVANYNARFERRA